MADKEFLTIDEQISLLQSRGLRISDWEKAKEFLLHHNYYRISGYSLTLRKNDSFYPNTSFENIMDIYEFDHCFRHILLEHIATIEVTIKSVYAYEFSKQYGPLAYLRSEHFTDSHAHTGIMDRAEFQAKQRLHNEAFLQHFTVNLKQSLPLWAFVDLLSFSDISKLYKITSKELQSAIAQIFGMKMNKGASILEKNLHSITILRNLCAHGHRLFNRLFITKPSLSSTEKHLLRKNADGSVDHSHLCGFVLNIRRLLQPSDFQSLKVKLIALTERYPFVSLRYYGFLQNYQEVL